MVPSTTELPWTRLRFIHYHVFPRVSEEEKESARWELDLSDGAVTCTQQKIQRAMAVDKLNDSGRKTCLWTVETMTLKGLETVCELCKVALQNFSERLGEVCAEQVCSYCQK